MNYVELQTKDIAAGSLRTFKLHCHLVGVQLLPFPKLFVTDYIENDGFLARLDFLSPIDLDGNIIISEKIFGVKLFDDKIDSALRILLKENIKLEGNVNLVFDKFLFLTLKLRIYRFNSKTRGLLLESILDEAEVLSYNPQNPFQKQLFNRCEEHFCKTSFNKNPKYRALMNQVAKPVQQAKPVKEEEQLQYDSLPLEDLNSEEFEQSTALEEDISDELLKSVSQNQQPKQTHQHSYNISQLHEVLNKNDYKLKKTKLFQITAKVVGISPSNMRDLITINKDNSIRLKHLKLFLWDKTDSVLEVTISQNLKILQFLIGDDITNNSTLQLFKLYYLPESIEGKISKVYKNRKASTFFVSWGTHTLDDERAEIVLQNWEFANIPCIDDLI